MSIFYEFDGTIEDSSGIKDFVLQIADPVVDTNTPYHDSFCRIHCPVLTRDFDVYGVDGNQAKELSMRYIRARLESAILRDKQGRVVNI